MTVERSLSIAALVACGAASWTEAAAQDLPRAPVVFLEKAYFSPLTPSGKNLIFEGQPTVHYFIRNRLSDQTWQREGGWKWAFPVSVLFQVRMSDTTSQPVRTPSFRIRPFYAQRIHLRRDTSDRLAFQLVGVSIGAAHYSNGQAGCTYLGYTRSSPGEDCVVSNPDLASRRRTNVVDGDFSTSYFSLSLNLRRGRLIDSDDPVKWQYTISAEVQAHPLNMKPGGANADQASQWGQHQWTIGGEIERRYQFGKTWKPLRILAGSSGVVRLSALQEQRFGGGVASPLDRTQVEMSYVVDRVENLGLFVRWHRGFDYYNIQFQDRRSFMAIGVMWDMSRLDKLNTAPPP